ncbi:kinesin motor domain-containing protein [Ditylenchus destructor]|uniref:Kinesin motor domain-containing protein n=1 Tax=Ditylenchus destructor TaxID=166010 RepID=A0AAD4NHX6_9BILA|nr:kinesin motor domain-containing protein [Ditylenchus destructor]
MKNTAVARRSSITDLRRSMQARKSVLVLEFSGARETFCHMHNLDIELETIMLALQFHQNEGPSGFQRYDARERKVRRRHRNIEAQEKQDFIRVYDLLSNNRNAVRVRGTDKVYLEGLTTLLVESKEDVKKALITGPKKRSTSATLMNDVSSRSHAIFHIRLSKNQIGVLNTTQRKYVSTSDCYFVDLAGSTALVDCVHLQETAAINCSLLALQKIIENKATNGGAYVNFRESVLTRLLKDCFGGNSKTALLATVASNPEHRAIKLQTLRFSMNASKLKLISKENVDPFVEEVKQLKAKNEFMAAELCKLRSDANIDNMSDVIADVPCVVELLVDTSFVKPQTKVDAGTGNVKFGLVSENDAIVEFCTTKKSVHAKCLKNELTVNGDFVDPLNKVELKQGDRLALNGVRFFVFVTNIDTPLHDLSTYHQAKLEKRYSQLQDDLDETEQFRTNMLNKTMDQVTILERPTELNKEQRVNLMQVHSNASAIKQMLDNIFKLNTVRCDEKHGCGSSKFMQARSMQARKSVLVEVLEFSGARETFCHMHNLDIELETIMLALQFHQNEGPSGFQRYDARERKVRRRHRNIEAQEKQDFIRVYDLLSNNRNAVRVRGTDKVYLEGLTTLLVESKEDVKKALITGPKKRSTSATLMNDVSSRSHAIFHIRLSKNQIGVLNTTQRKYVSTSDCYFVDLAGSTALVDCVHLQETAAINCSLLALQKIIENKATNGGAYVNFRESVLTRLLKDCFGGNSKTALLATVASNPEHRAIKLQTLRFSMNASKLKLISKENVDPFVEEVKQLKAKNEFMAAELCKLRSDANIDNMSDVIADVPCVVELLVDTSFVKPQTKVDAGTGNVKFGLVSENDAIVEFCTTKKSVHAKCLKNELTVNGDFVDPLNKVELKQGDRLALNGVRFFVFVTNIDTPLHDLSTYHQAKLEKRYSQLQDDLDETEQFRTNMLNKTMDQVTILERPTELNKEQRVNLMQVHSNASAIKQMLDNIFKLNTTLHSAKTSRGVLNQFSTAELGAGKAVALVHASTKKCPCRSLRFGGNSRRRIILEPNDAGAGITETLLRLLYDIEESFGSARNFASSGNIEERELLQATFTMYRFAFGVDSFKSSVTLLGMDTGFAYIIAELCTIAQKLFAEKNKWIASVIQTSSRNELFAKCVDTQLQKLYEAVGCLSFWKNEEPKGLLKANAAKQFFKNGVIRAMQESCKDVRSLYAEHSTVAFGVLRPLVDCKARICETEVHWAEVKSVITQLIVELPTMEDIDKKLAAKVRSQLTICKTAMDTKQD